MKDKPTTNPFGANGTTSDPREQKCWELYVESVNEGRENAYQAAVEAGYEDKTARQITVRSWFLERKEKLKRKEMLSDAEKVLKKTLKYATDDINDEGKFIIKSDVLRIQTDVAKFIASTQGKDDGYTTRTEQTGKDGKDLTIILNPELEALSKKFNEELKKKL